MSRKIKSKNKYCFASEFVAARSIAGFTVAGAAKICGRDVRTIKDWESERKPCPQWALRLITLESRHMDALYGLQHDRAIKCAIGLYRTTMPANENDYSTQIELKLVS